MLFDGEEATDDDRDFLATGVRGSKAYARAPRATSCARWSCSTSSPTSDLRIPREAGSDAELWARLRARRQARRRRAARSRTSCGGEITDDHTPFTAAAACPSIDLIDFDFPCWHETLRRPVARSRASSLDRSGEAVLELLRTWR